MSTLKSNLGQADLKKRLDKIEQYAKRNQKAEPKIKKEATKSK